VIKLNLNIIFCCLTALLMLACGNNQTVSLKRQVSINPQDIVLFYLDSLQHHNLIKVVTVNGNSDTNKIMRANWIKEMDFLEAINTNKPAYKGTLSMDTMRIVDTLVYHLTCNDQKLNLKEVFIYYHQNQLLHMTMKSFGSNFLFNNAKEIYFNPFKGYLIKGFQNLDVLSKQQIEYTILVNKI